MSSYSTVRKRCVGGSGVVVIVVRSRRVRFPSVRWRCVKATVVRWLCVAVAGKPCVKHPTAKQFQVRQRRS